MADFTGITQTANLKLYKPGYSNVADIEVLNANADALDAAYKEYKATAVEFTGATSSKAGVKGYVPAPKAGDQNKVLAGDGTWKTPFTESDIAKIAHPVGSVLAFADGTNPNAKWSGMTWVQFAQGRTLVGAGTYSENGTNYTYVNGETGGEAKHKLTLPEIPKHSHWAGCSTNGGHFHGCFGDNNKNPYGIYDPAANYAGASGADWNNPTGRTSTDGDHSHTVTIGDAGGDGYHENRQPYVVVTYWKRTA